MLLGPHAPSWSSRIVPTSSRYLVSPSASLAHVMLRVPSVDATVNFWINEMDGQVVRSTETTDGTIKSAFVSLGGSFALELAPSTNPFELGNSIDYIGISMLQQQQKQKQQSQPSTSNDGIPLRRVASAPGDALARWVMHSNDLSATADFYTKVLGMESMGYNDEEMICLRYPNNDSGGVPTTLLFTPPPADAAEIAIGNCFDHLAITIQDGDMDQEYAKLQEHHHPIFMKPTLMFGTMVMGVVDPNGYKVVLAAKRE